MKHFDKLNQVGHTRHTGDDKRGLLFQFMMGIFLDVTRMNHGRDKTPDPHDLLLPHLAFDRPADLAPCRSRGVFFTLIFFDRQRK